MAENDGTNETGQATEAGKGAWTPPESQEALDQIVQARVARAAEKVEQRVKQDFEGYLPPDEAEKLKAQIAERDQKLTEYERESIATAAGLPKGFGARLQGDSAESWAQDAESLAGALVAGFAPKETVTPELKQEPAPGYQPREQRRGVGGGNPSVLDELVAKSPSELVQNMPRI